MEEQNNECPLFSENELKILEEKLKNKGRSERKSSVDKRGSIRMKYIAKQISNFKKEEADIIETLAKYLSNAVQYFDQLEEFFNQRHIHFLTELKEKATVEDYISFLGCLELYKLPQNGRLQQEGKYHHYHYVILEGAVSAFKEKKLKDDEKQFIEIFEYQTGEALISNSLVSHKYNPYTNRAKRFTLLFRFSDENYLKYLKRLHQKQVDEIAYLLNHNVLFKGVSMLDLKRYISYCFFQYFKYNDQIYVAGEKIKHIYIILQGQVEISYEKQENRQTDPKTKQNLLAIPNLYKVNHHSQEKREIKIVKLNKKEAFGIQITNISKQAYYQHNSKVKSDRLKILVIGLEVLAEIEAQNPFITQNISLYLKRINNMHSIIIQNNEKIVEAINAKNLGSEFKKKKKKKKGKKREVSLEWWGLAEKFVSSKQYKLPTPPKAQSQKRITRKASLNIFEANRPKKIQYFKRRLFEQQLQQIEEVGFSEKQNQSPFKLNYIPKMQKVKIKMLNIKPKVVNHAERIKKKLVDYAKNGEVYCDRLQLE